MEPSRGARLFLQPNAACRKVCAELFIISAHVILLWRVDVEFYEHCSAFLKVLCHATAIQRCRCCEPQNLLHLQHTFHVNHPRNSIVSLTTALFILAGVSLRNCGNVA